MTFRLEKQTPGAEVTRFHVLDTNGICGIITVENSEAEDLQKHWNAAPHRQPKRPNR